MKQLTDSGNVKMFIVLVFSFVLFSFIGKARQGGITADLQLHNPFEDASRNTLKRITSAPSNFERLPRTPCFYSDENVVLDYTSRLRILPIQRKLVISAEECCPLYVRFLDACGKRVIEQWPGYAAA